MIVAYMLGVQVMYDQVLEHTDAGVAVGDAVVTFDTVAVLIPRGRFDVELYPSFMKLLGQVCVSCPSLHFKECKLCHFCNFLVPHVEGKMCLSDQFTGRCGGGAGTRLQGPV